MAASGNQVKTTPPETFVSDGAIGAYRIVKFGAEDGTAAIASAATAPLLGVSGEVGVDAAEKRIDVHTSGGQRVYYGGTVTRGDDLTSDANGAAVVTTTAGNHIVGRARISGVAGDLGTVEIRPCVRGGA